MTEQRITDDIEMVEIADPYPEIIVHLSRGKLGWSGQAFCSVPDWDERLFPILMDTCGKLDASLGFQSSPGCQERKRGDS